MEIGGTALQNRVNVAAAVTSLGRVVEAGTDLEFLDGVRVGNRRVRQFAKRVVGSRDALDQIVVVIFSAPVHVDAHIPAAQCGCIVQASRGARREIQQLLKVARCQRQRSHGRVIDGLACSGVGSIDSRHFRVNLNFLFDR